MSAIASIGAAIITFALGNLRVSTGMLIGQLLLAVFALLMWQGQSVMAYFVGYFFVGGYHLYRSMALAFSRSLVKVGNTGLTFYGQHFRQSLGQSVLALPNRPS